MTMPPAAVARAHVGARSWAMGVVALGMPLGIVLGSAGGIAQYLVSFVMS